MPKETSAVTVPIPRDLYQQVERVRRRRGKTRGAVIRDALSHWLAQQEEAKLVREYKAGYRRRPESPREISAAKAAAVQLLATMEW
jgi:metal-responsive CopG/Arc/MetJ family transcriptional regulator